MDATRIAALGMQHDLKRLDVVSHNLANTSTVGYKRQTQPVGGQFSNLVSAIVTESVTSSGQASVDVTPGTLKHTGSFRDIAIEGPGFLEVATPSGAQFTRQGNLRVDLGGKLVGEHGFPVLGESGDITLGEGTFAIDATGNVRQGDRIMARLKLVHFDDSNKMVPLGGGLYAQGGARLAQKETRSSVRAGFLENSNVSSPQEMVHLSEIVRHFESMQKIMQGYDDSLEKTLRKLGDF